MRLDIAVTRERVAYHVRNLKRPSRRTRAGNAVLPPRVRWLGCASSKGNIPEHRPSQGCPIRGGTGEVIRATDDDELVQKVEQHVDQAHPELVGKMSRDDVLAMAEEA